jgi:hypothetical protein
MSSRIKVRGSFLRNGQPAVRRFRQSFLDAVFLSLGILVLLAIRWYAFVKNLSGRPVTWKGRPYLAGHALDSTAWIVQPDEETDAPDPFRG